MALAFLVNGIVPCAIGSAGTPKLGAFGVGPVEQRVRPFFVVLLRGLRCLVRALPRARELGRVLVLSLRENSATRGDRLRLLVLSSLMLPRFMRLVQTSASRRIPLRGSQDVGLLSRHFGYGEVQSG